MMRNHCRTCEHRRSRILNQYGVPITSINQRSAVPPAAIHQRSGAPALLATPPLVFVAALRWVWGDRGHLARCSWKPPGPACPDSRDLALFF